MVTHVLWIQDAAKNYSNAAKCDASQNLRVVDAKVVYHHSLDYMA